MDTTQLLKGVLDVAVLAVIRDEDGYGYDIVRRLRAAGIDEVGDASVYGTLRRLYSAGMLSSPDMMSAKASQSLVWAASMLEPWVLIP